VEEDDQPEDKFIALLGGFVAEAALGEEGRGPAAQQFEEMQMRFGYAPAAGDGTLFVVAVGGPGDDGYANEVTNSHSRIESKLLEGEAGQQQKEQEEEEAADGEAGIVSLMRSIHSARSSFGIKAHFESDDVTNLGWSATRKISNVEKDAI